MKKLFFLFPFFFIMVSFAFSENPRWVRVLRVVDMENIRVVDDAGKLENLKLFGLKAPENPDSGEDSPLNHTKNLMEGKTVKILTAPGGKNSVLVWLNDGTPVNLQILSDGYARLDEVIGAENPLWKPLSEAEESACAEGRGIWKDTKKAETETSAPVQKIKDENSEKSSAKAPSDTDYYKYNGSHSKNRSGINNSGLKMSGRNGYAGKSGRDFVEFSGNGGYYDYYSTSWGKSYSIGKRRRGGYYRKYTSSEEDSFPRKPEPPHRYQYSSDSAYFSAIADYKASRLQYLKEVKEYWRNRRTDSTNSNWPQGNGNYYYPSIYNTNMNNTTIIQYRQKNNNQVPAPKSLRSNPVKSNSYNKGSYSGGGSKPKPLKFQNKK